MRYQSLAVPLGLLLATSCVSLSRAAPQRLRYTLSTERAAATTRASQGVLLVRPFQQAATCAQPEMLFLRGAVLESDYYHSWFNPPAMLLGDAAVQWLDRTGLCQAVVHHNSRLTPSLVLEADLLTWQTELPAGGTPRFVGRLRLLWLTPEQKVLATHECVASTPVLDEPSDIARGASAVAEQLFRQAELELTQILQRP